jgi:ribosomal protein S18 acetylase RimI-like enzyme
MKLRVRFRDLQAPDLSDLDWSGGPEHVRQVAAALQAAYAGEAAAVVGALGNDRLVAMGVVDFRPDPDAGALSVLAVHPRMQSLGIGARLIEKLERRVAAQPRRWARLTVELDNPRAAALYRRLGYTEAGPALDSWPVAGGQTYVAACIRMERDLQQSAGVD